MNPAVKVVEASLLNLLGTSSQFVDPDLPAHVFVD